MMSLETVGSTALLAGFLWAIRFLLPRAIKERDAMALTCAVLTALLALVGWLMIGVGVQAVGRDGRQSAADSRVSTKDCRPSTND